MSGGGNPVDFGELANDSAYEVTVKRTEKPEELASRLRRDEAEAAHKRRVFWALFAVVVAVGIFGTLTALLNNDPQTKEWARTVASAIIAGLIGYFGGSIGKASP